MFTATKDLLESQSELGEALDKLGETIDKMPEGTEKGKLLQMHSNLYDALREHETSTERLLTAMDNIF